jgi:acyl-CoA thioesterase-1
MTSNAFKRCLRLLPLIALLLVGACQQNPASTPTTNSTPAPTTHTTPTPTAQQKFIIFFGNSLTAGYGVDADQAFPARIQQKIDSLKLPYHIQNAGNSGETTAGGLQRIDWILKQKPDIFILELGGNDGLRGLPVTQMEQNLQQIINKVKTANPNVHILLAGMQMLPNLGKDYVNSFNNTYPALARKNGITLIPFLLDGVGGEPHLNQPDGIHPNPEGHAKVAETVWKYLQPLL